MKCSISWDVRVTIVRCSGLERSRRGKMFYCNIRTPVHRIAIPKVMWLLYPKFWVQTFGIATLWTGVSVFCNLHTAFPLYCPVCVPRPRSGFYWHRSRFRSCYYVYGILQAGSGVFKNGLHASLLLLTLRWPPLTLSHAGYPWRSGEHSQEEGLEQSLFWWNRKIHHHIYSQLKF